MKTELKAQELDEKHRKAKDLVEQNYWYIHRAESPLRHERAPEAALIAASGALLLSLDSRTDSKKPDSPLKAPRDLASLRCFPVTLFPVAFFK